MHELFDVKIFHNFYQAHENKLLKKRIASQFVLW